MSLIVFLKIVFSSGTVIEFFFFNKVWFSIDILPSFRSFIVYLSPCFLERKYVILNSLSANSIIWIILSLLLLTFYHLSITFSCFTCPVVYCIVCWTLWMLYCRGYWWCSVYKEYWVLFWKSINLLVNNPDCVEISCEAFVTLSVFHFFI